MTKNAALLTVDTAVTIELSWFNEKYKKYSIAAGNKHGSIQIYTDEIGTELSIRDGLQRWMSNVVLPIDSKNGGR